MRRLLKPFWVALALLFLAEAWLWERLAPVVGWLVDRLALPALKARVARLVEALPPYPTLLVFLIPVALLFPLKLLGLWMLARGSWLGALAVLAAAKMLSVGVTAFIFDITRPKLLQLGWFRWVYGKVMIGLGWAHRQIDPLKARMRAWARRHVTPVLRRMRARLRWFRRARGARLVRRMLRIRRRAQRA